MSSSRAKVAGLGSPIIDVMVRVDDAWLAANVHGEKGGMNAVDDRERRRLLSAIEHSGLIPEYAIGGSAFNTIGALARLGMKTSFIGKTGRDADGAIFRRDYLAIGGDPASLRDTASSSTATCLCLVTPDSQRTMRSHLGASLLMTPEDICDRDFEIASHLHIEGFQFFIPGLVRAAVTTAKRNGCTVSLDFAAFEVVRLFRTEIRELLPMLDIVFANEDEAQAFQEPGSGTPFSPEAALQELADICGTAVVKTGIRGAWIRSGGRSVHVDSVQAVAADTTGAGDFWQAGFLYGMLNNCSLEDSGKLGALLSARVVEVLGAQLPENVWQEMRTVAAALPHLS